MTGTVFIFRWMKCGELKEKAAYKSIPKQSKAHLCTVLSTFKPEEGFTTEESEFLHLFIHVFKMSQLKMKNGCVLILTHFHLVFCNLPLKYIIHHVAYTFKMYTFFLSKSIFFLLSWLLTCCFCQNDYQ